jgi:predicted TIM-barrel fold metal-dependent hydrolase
MQEMIQIVKSADFLSESDKEKVLGGNAKKVLKI